MCSASMGAEGSVTLQLREAVQAPVSESNGSMSNTLAIGYHDSEILADMLGTFQAAGADTTFDIIENGEHRQQNLANAIFKANGISTSTINKNEAGNFKIYAFFPDGSLIS